MTAPSLRPLVSLQGLALVGLSLITLIGLAPRAQAQDAAAAAPALAPTPVAIVSGPVSVDQVRAQWAAMRKAYLDSSAAYATQPEHSTLLKEYNTLLDETGKSLEGYIALRLARSAPATLTPAVDKLIGNLTRLKAMQAKASGNLITVLGNALKQQQMITQNAIKNMR